MTTPVRISTFLKKFKCPPYRSGVLEQWPWRHIKSLTNQLLYAFIDIVNVKNSKYAFMYSNILDVPQVRTTRHGKKSFMFAAATQWNDPPNHFRAENSFNHFKSLIQSWNGSVCRCSACRYYSIPSYF
jgi:hypothetical protein